MKFDVSKIQIGTVIQDESGKALGIICEATDKNVILFDSWLHDAIMYPIESYNRLCPEAKKMIPVIKETKTKTVFDLAKIKEGCMFFGESERYLRKIIKVEGNKIYFDVYSKNMTSWITDDNIEGLHNFPTKEVEE